MRWPEPAARLLLLLAAGCAGGPSAAGMPPPDPAVADALALRAGFALEADGRMEAADSLYSTDAELIAAGRRVARAPRFAGVEAGGQVAVGSSRVDIRQGLAWALVEYRWVAAGRALREGRATLVFSRQDDGRWLITHAHSSLRE